MIPNPFRVKVVRGLWNPPPGGATSSWPWSNELVHAIFQGANGWSLRDYWLRSSFGLLNLDFDIYKGRVNLGGLDANHLSHNRGEAIDAVRAHASSVDGVPVDGYNGFVALVNPPPCNAGARGSDALFDQGGYLEFFQHEIGHVLGFHHAFGPDTGADQETVYEDPYCVMGFTGPHSFTIPTPPEGSSVVTPLPGHFWQSGRRLSAANLYRSYPNEFAPWVRRFSMGSNVVVGAASAVAEIGSPGPAPPLAVLTLPDGGGELTVEYRVNTVDDRGITPAVVVHSIGRRVLGSTADGKPWGEANPVWFEGTIAPVPGNRLQSHRIVIEVVSTSPSDTRPPHVEINVREI